MRKFSAFPFLIAAFASLALGCPSPIENSITSELLKPVAVTLSGTVKALDTGLAMSGVTVKVQKLNPSDNSKSFVQLNGADASATTDLSGKFSFASSLSLDVDTYQHYIYLSDPSAAYYDSDSTLIYAMKDATLAYESLVMYAKAPASYTVVSGTVKDIIEGTAVSGLTVKLTPKGSTTAMQATTNASGAFSVDKVPVTQCTLELGGLTTYITESDTIVLSNSATNALGDLLVSKASAGNDIRIVLSWTDSTLDLDSTFSLPNSGFIFNHLGIKQVKLPSSIISVNPAFKFAEGTAYWPENMGGAKDDTNRVKVNPKALTAGKPTPVIITPVNPAGTAYTLLELDKDSTDGTTPEVTTLYNKHPLSSIPQNLAYNYDFPKAGVNPVPTYFPIGMGVFNVICNSKNGVADQGSIYDSGATVKVYQGSTYLGKFTAADLAIDTGESNRRFWPVLQVEIGYTTASPSQSLSTTSELYYRIVPYGSAGAVPPDKFPGYFYQETKLPGNETFTVWLDKANYSRDYDLAPPPYPERVLASASGKLYSYDFNGGLSWKIKSSTPTTYRGFLNGYYWGSNAENLYLSQESSATQPPLWYLEAISTTLIDNVQLNIPLKDRGSTPGVNVYDSTLVRFMSDQTFLLLATDKGPRGASTITGEQEPNLSVTPQPGWQDNTGGVIFARSLMKVLPARNAYGAIGKYALIGGAGLFIFNAAYANYSNPTWTSKATLENVVNQDGTCNLSSNNFNVTSLVQFPPKSSSFTFLIAGFESPSLTKKFYEINLNASGGYFPLNVNHIKELPVPPELVNDMMFIQSGREPVLIAATDKGIYKTRSYSTSGSWDPYLPDMLGNFKVTKLFDYNGKLGLFAENNGLISGPYPE